MSVQLMASFISGAISRIQCDAVPDVCYRTAADIGYPVDIIAFFLFFFNIFLLIITTKAWMYALTQILNRGFFNFHQFFDKLCQCVLFCAA